MEYSFRFLVFLSVYLAIICLMTKEEVYVKYMALNKGIQYIAVKDRGIIDSKENERKLIRLRGLHNTT